MTKKEIEKYLSLGRLLDRKGYSTDNKGVLDCPFHKDCKESWKLYEELNKAACMRESCSMYRQVFGVFELISQLEDCNEEQALLLGKSLVFKELELWHRETRLKERLSEREQELLSRLRKAYGGKAFSPSQARLELHLKHAKTTLLRHFQKFEKEGHLERVGGNQQKGYEYVLSW